MRTRTKLGIVALVVVIATLGSAELALRKLYGLGNPVLYDSYPLYGYRLKPNQRVKRTGGAEIAVNNLGLRADSDWDANPTNKVLFLGDSVTYGGSYVSNDELFSAVAVRDLPGFMAGNGGVNAWGVENIHGLIVGTEFLPAGTYVTVLPEGDFYRGITRLPGLPFWSRKPKGALIEVIYYFLNQANLRRYEPWETAQPTGRSRRVVGHAVAKLAEMDRFIRGRGYRHLIYITPTREQMNGTAGKDSLVEQSLLAQGLSFSYLVDRLKNRNLPDGGAAALYVDEIHLKVQGHQLWGRAIGEDLRRILAGKPGTGQ